MVPEEATMGGVEVKRETLTAEVVSRVLAEQGVDPEVAERVVSGYRDLEAQNRHLQALSERDSLTGLRNRRAFDNDLPVELSRARRNKDPVAILYLDLNNLKRVNDGEGGSHSLGDQYIQDAVGLLKREIYRPTDQIYRVGGDEFVVILSKCNTEGAERVSRRVQRAVAKVRRLAETGRVQRDYVDVAGLDNLGLSIGIAATDKVSPEQLKTMADEAMYVAKGNGKKGVGDGVGASL